MRETLPIVEHMAAMTTDADRAAWLRQCPDSVVIERHGDIRIGLRDVGFSDAIAYLWARLAALQAVRDPDGRLPMRIERTLALADSRMGHCG